MGASHLATAYLAIRADRPLLQKDLSTVRSMVVSTMQGAVATASGILAAVGVQKLVSGVTDFLGRMVDGASRLEQYQISLGVMLKDVDRAKTLMKEIQQFAAVTPFNVPSLMSAVQQMKAYGFETEKLLPMLRIIGDAASAAPGGMELGLERITRALGQMRAKGKVSGEEMRQLTEAGVAGWEMLAEAMGITVADAMALVTKGAISADQGIAAILAGMDKRFGGMMAKQSQSFQGLMSTLEDTIDMLLASVGEAVMPVLKSLLRLGESLVGVFQKIANGELPGVHAAMERIAAVIDGITEKIKAVDFANWKAGALQVLDILREGFSAVAEMLGTIFEDIADRVSIKLKIAIQEAFHSMFPAIGVEKEPARVPLAKTIRDAARDAMKRIRNINIGLPEALNPAPVLPAEPAAPAKPGNNNRLDGLPKGQLADVKKRLGAAMKWISGLDMSKIAKGAAGGLGIIGSGMNAIDSLLGKGAGGGVLRGIIGGIFGAPALGAVHAGVGAIAGGIPKAANAWAERNGKVEPPRMEFTGLLDYWEKLQTSFSSDKDDKQVGKDHLKESQKHTGLLEKAVGFLAKKAGLK